MSLEQAGARTRFADDERDALLALGRGPELPAAAPVPDLVAEYAEANHDHVAVESAGAALTYDQLDRWAGRVAGRLAAAGVRPGQRVGLLVEPSTAMVAAALGVLRAGAAYVPVDAAHPDQRIAAQLADAQVACVLTTEAAKDRCGGLPTVFMEDTHDGPVAPAVPVAADDPAYLIYTSGSTGEPKGVVVEHGQLAASTLARRRVYPGRPVFLLVSPLAFDSSVAGLWGTLTAGGRLVVATADEVRDPSRLVEIVRDHQVTHLLCVPSLYGVLLDAADRAGQDGLRSLTTVIVAGEVLPQSLVERHFARQPHTELVNEYGPTETTVWASYLRLTAPGPVTIGVPVPGARLYVLDDQQRPVPRGVDGELHIGGAGVARGYHGRPEATAAAFLDDPFVPGGRMYRTGDIARWTAEGTLDFRGRRDHQVKVRGHRVELGAVEAALRAVPGVRDAAVIPDAAGTHLIGFVAADAVTAEDARAALAARLPEAWVPARVHVLDRLPVTVNGKVDRARLAALPVQAAPRPAAADDTTAHVAAAWAEVLGVPDVPTDVNFFDLGGHSLTMFHLQDALESRTGTRPSVVALFRHTTVAAQAALIRDGGSTPEESAAGMREAAARRAAAMRARRQRAERGAAK
ncbi:non-ribosomal peptide synthetase [Actinokineospora sp. NPDC004072]